jgi:hypothetical protein
MRNTCAKMTLLWLEIKNIEHQLEAFHSINFLKGFVLKFLAP